MLFDCHGPCRVWRHYYFCEKSKKPATYTGCWLFYGLGKKIRTSGLLNPIQARYQTAPYPDGTNDLVQR